MEPGDEGLPVGGGGFSDERLGWALVGTVLVLVVCRVFVTLALLSLSVFRSCAAYVGGVFDSTRQDEQACEAGEISERQIEQTQSLLFSSNPRAAASGNVLDPSGSGENVQQLRSLKIDPAKHKVFLSHSGAQKNFVEQLCVDLEARGYLFPFFDQRHHSLPRGKDFAPLIKQAARQCNVAVIVLSEEFLCSKWPMIELAEFHAAKQGGNHGMSMLPLFYKLKVGDLDDKSIEGRWMPIWKELGRWDKRIDVSEWAAAVRALRGVNGLPFDKHNNSEVGYRKEIVRSIWKMWAGDLRYDSAREMVGYDRICERVSTKFVECNVVGASVLGLYGLSGLGKTIVAKGLCDYFAGEFEGRVCHVELEATTRMKRQEWILKSLCGVEDKVLKRLVDDHKGLKLMRDCMNREPVLLVIDNLTNDESSRREAHEYLSVGFHPRSKIMITARSKEVLQDLVPSVEFCMSIPKLNEVEAEMIFLRCAAPMKCLSSVTDEERKVLRLFVEKCLMDSDDFGSYVREYSKDLDSNENPKDTPSISVPKYKAYHPLALSALGNYFYKLGANTKMLQWKDSLDKDHELLRDLLQSPSITSIIRLQFSTFSWREQLLFLDLAVYIELYYEKFQYNSSCTGDTLSWMGWLGMMHEEPTSIIKSRMQDLHRSGMITWNKVIAMYKVHSIYRQFAKWYMTEHGVTGLKNAQGVFQPCCTRLGYDHQGSKNMFDLVRLRVFEIQRASIWILTNTRMRELQNLVLLQLYDCNNLGALNLARLDNLRHLELVRLSKLVTVTLVESSRTRGDGGILESLVYVLLSNLDSLTHLPDLRSSTSLRSFHIFQCQKVTTFEEVECPHVRRMTLLLFALHQLERPPYLRALHCIMSLGIIFDGRFGLLDAMELVIPDKWNRRRRGVISVALQDRKHFDENIDGFEEFLDYSDEADELATTIIYMRHEEHYVKEGLIIVQDLMSYMYKHGQLECQVSNSALRWEFHKGHKEVLTWYDSFFGHHRTIEWKFRNAEEFDSEEDYDFEEKTSQDRTCKVRYGRGF